MSAARGILEGKKYRYKNKISLLMVLCAAFPLRSGERGRRDALRRGRNRGRQCSVCKPLPLVRFGGWHGAGLGATGRPGLCPGCPRVQGASGSVPDSGGVGRKRWRAGGKLRGILAQEQSEKCHR